MPVVVNNNGSTSEAVQVPVVAAHPGTFELDGTNAAALHAAGYQFITPSSPAAKGEKVLIYATGLGPVNSSPGTGNPASGTTSSRTTLTPSVTVGGVTAAVEFSGLAPGFVGLYQINIVIPDGAGSGSLDLIVSVSGIASTPVKLAVQK